ncbi:hypothetical protein RHMOL_Rhmol08G0243300 [Rhododendron molle]|uniref:Uncharacterized protein n=1 Tax=Rhododendron molle TaxID=49168 RepID=A0ACC0MTF3_RHOML|nr:hypothetical protein RHMOL_Rhmol08G0243300 [Rhododendron molle]
MEVSKQLESTRDELTFAEVEAEKANTCVLRHEEKIVSKPSERAEIRLTDALAMAKARKKELYNLGARKFVVFEFAPLSCLPDIVDKTKPSTLCDEQINGLVSVFNTNLGAKLSKLKSVLNGSSFVTAKSYRLIHDIIYNPLHHGFSDARRARCASGVDGSGDCKPGTVPCQSRKSHVFWDRVHPTEAIYERIASECFNGKGLCTPMNIVQLAGKRGQVPEF